MNSLKLFLFLGYLIAIISGCSFFSDSSNSSDAGTTEDVDPVILTFTSDSIIATLNITQPYIYSYTDSTIVREAFENTCSKGGVFDSTWRVDEAYYEIRNDTFYYWISDSDCYAKAHVGGGPGLQDGEWLEVGEAALPSRPDYCDAPEFEAYDLTQEKAYVNYDGPTLQYRVEQPLCVAADIDGIAIGNAEVLDCSKLSLDMSAVSDSIEGVLIYEYLTLNTETIEFTIRHSFNNQSCIETKPRGLWYPRTEEECQDSWDMYVTAGGESDFPLYYFDSWLPKSAPRKELEACLSEKGIPNIYEY